MLDDLESISKIDKSKMLDAVANFPEQIKETRNIVSPVSFDGFLKINNIVISGMGASAISGDIVQNLLKDRIDVPIFVSRQYELPKWVDKNTLLISQSYSGNTEETLSTFKSGFQKRCKIIGISSGGKLQEYCEKRQIPHVKIPSGFPPRAATGYILFSSIHALGKIGLLKDGFELDIDETISLMEETRNRNKKDVLEKDNLSKQLARKILGTIPQVYGFDFYAPIARRWCTQLNENSKVICRYDEVPECNHNDIVGWSMNPEVSKNCTCIMFRDSENESVFMSKRLNFMKKLFEEVSKNVMEIQVQGKKRLAKMMYAMYIGDFTSCYLAILRNIDPTPVDAITELKNELSRI